MQIGVPAETRAYEARVAATPETVKKYVAAGHRVLVERDAGAAASFPDAAYAAASAELTDRSAAFGAELVLKVQAPTEDETAWLARGAVLVGMLEPFNATQAAPRTTRAQSLDVLPSQANIAGYKAVLVAAGLYPRFLPMLMTAAGTVKAARVLVLGAGVAGLQAIATAKRLGAVIEASDVRPAVKEQIESLGAKFLDVPFETDEEREAAQADIVITTALIPGRPVPTLIRAETVAAMKPGSVLVDLAAGRGPEIEGEGRRGGNCPLTLADQVVTVHGVTIAGHTNLAAQVAADASALYARNLADFLKLIVSKDGALTIDLTDDIVAATLLCRDGELVRK
ncbi:MAG: NAD(P) transhydrogenase subunit alpha part 1 [Burkholderia plantarii]|nr:MAG: NAD(P) transhydrogenase subunit alpha part 1 [Burkholderia plantarii]